MISYNCTEQIHDDQTGEVVGTLTIQHVKADPIDVKALKFGGTDLTDFNDMPVKTRSIDERQN